MCLTRVDPKPRRKFGIGYKSVERLENGTYACYDYYPNVGTVRYPLNQWITDPNDGDAYTPSYAHESKYRTGFHIVLDKGVALRLSRLFHRRTVVIIKVKFRKVVATQIGEPDSLYGRQVVAREIMNLGEVLS